METTMFVLDGSEWMRNGDFVPDRLTAQRETVYDACKAKLMAHPENLVGLIASGNGSATVVTNLTNNEGAIYTSLVEVAPNGVSDVVSAIQVAQLALKHRPNPIQRQRIILFVGSPVVADKKTLVKLGKQLKKNKVSVDVVNFGEADANAEKLGDFVNAVDSGDSSHIVNVASGDIRNLRDIVLSSEIMGGAGASAAMGGMDDDIARAIALSLQESGGAAPAAGDAPGSAPGAGAAAPAAAFDMDADVAFLTEEEQIQRALAMSMMETEPTAPATDDASPADMDTQPTAAADPSGPTGVADALDDPSVLDSLLSGLPGVDADTIRDMMGGGSGGSGNDDDANQDGDNNTN